MKDDLNKTLEILRAGGVILYPTDTVWGLGCDATNANAVSKIFSIKEREDNKSLIILLDQIGRLNSYISEVPNLVYDIFEIADQPLTLILEGAKNLAENVVNQSDDSIGIRITKDEFCKELIHKFKKPIVSTSANISGKLPPKCFDDINEKIKTKSDYVVKYRQDDIRKIKPSSIMQIKKDGTIKIIRK